MTDDAQDVLWGLRNVTTGKLMLEVFRTEVAAELAAARHTNRWRKVEALALAPLAPLVEEADEADRCSYCADGDPVPAKGYWRCPECDAEWHDDEDEDQ